MADLLPPDPDGKNRDRANWASVTLGELRLMTGCDAEDALCDFLADVAHYCDRTQIDFANELRRAARHYYAETDERGMQFSGVDEL